MAYQNIEMLDAGRRDVRAGTANTLYDIELK